MTMADALPSLDDTAHIIQVALTPVFLLAGVANLLAVFANRLARIADRVDYLAQELAKADPKTGPKADPKEIKHLKAQFRYLQRRSWALDIAVVLGSIGGAATCAAALDMFVGALQNRAGTLALFGFFGLALVATIGALVAFLIEVLMAGRFTRSEIAARWHLPPGG